MEQTVLITMSAEDFRTIIREEVAKATKHLEPRKELPFFLTVKEAKELLRISDSKMYELMGRPDFPVCREAGVKIYTDELLAWVEANTPALQKKRRTLSVS